MTTPQFEDYYKKLNPRQKQAVDTVEGSVMVVAGPGTGKTQILTLRIANILLKTDTNPSNILALAFTESAVLAMRKRLVEIIGPDGYKVYISTFHGFCNEIIQNHPEDFPHLISSTSITELEQIEIIQAILEASSLKVLRPFGDPLYYTRSILSATNDLKKENISPEKFPEVVKNMFDDYQKITDLYYDKGANKGKKKGKYLTLERDVAKNQELAEVYEKYQSELKRQRFYDYNDMIVEVVSALQKNSELLTLLQEKYQYLLVDEHQDTNASQNKIIELLSSFYPDPNLFVVGDEKQAIYRFQGASLENFLYFKSLYKNAVLINLDQNYRSSQTVLDAAASLISKNILPEDSGIIRENLKAQQSFEKLPVKVVETDNYYAEYLNIANDIKNKINSGISPNQIAVIYRNNKDATPLADVFNQLKIPYLIHSEQDLLTDIDIQKLLMILKAVEHFGQDEYLFPLLNLRLFKITPLDSFKIIQFSRKSHLSLYDLLKSSDKIKTLDLENAEALTDLYGKLVNWSALKNDDSLENLFTYLVNESGLLKMLFEKADSLTKLEKLTGLYQELKNLVEKRSNVTLSQFLNHLDLLTEHQILIKKPVKNNQQKAVNLMTAHRSKGLEFEYVYITQAFDKHWGNKRSHNSFNLPWQELGVLTTSHELEDPNQDERRLFYVAMTRAKKQVIISYSKVGFDGKEQLPTQFIEEIDEAYKDKEIFESKDEELNDFTEKLLSVHQTMELKVDDREFLKELFLVEGLSVSGLNNYLKCPWQYFYENLLQIPTIKDKQQIFGTAIHHAICKTHSLDNPNKNQLVSFFKEVLDRQPISHREYKELLERGTEILSNYFDNYRDLWNKDVICELNIKNVSLSDQIRINGRIDRIAKVPNSKEVVIFDIKTGKPKTRGTIEGTTLESRGDYKRQLNFYKLLLDGYEGGRMIAKTGVIDFVEPDSKGEFHQERFEYDESELKVLKDQILDVGRQIMNLEFWDSRCEDKDCQYCQLRDILNS